MFQLLLVLAVALATALLFGKTGSWKKIAAIGLLVYPAIIAANVGTYWWFFIKVEAWLRDAGWGVNPYLLKAATGALAFLLTAIAPAASGALVKSRKWAFATVSVGSYCAMNVFLFAVSRPQPDQVSNPNNGEPLYKYYRDPVGNCVERFPRHYEFHPNHVGVRLLLPDDKIVQEWRSHPCRTDSGEAAPKSTPGSEARHEASMDEVHFAFEACSRLGADIVCTISATNNDRDDRTVTWKHDVVATDSEGNVHYASRRDVGGQWETDSFFGLNPYRCEGCDFASLLIAHVVTRFHARFEGVADPVNALQNLRVTVCCAGLFNKDVDLDFTSLAIAPDGIRTSLVIRLATP
jgi:hypothetical protein